MNEPRHSASGAIITAGALAIMTATLGGLWWSGRFAATDRNASTTRSSHAAMRGHVAAAERTSGQIRLASNRSIEDGSATVDLSPLDWRDPFETRYWDARGWKFDDEGMTCPPNREGIATFRRTFLGPTIELRLEPLETNSVDTVREIEIRLEEPSSASACIVRIEPRRTTIRIRRDGIESVVDERKWDAAMSAEHPGFPRLVATGERCTLFWNDRSVCHADQPREHSGKPVTITLFSKTGGLKISAMRLEGRSED